MAERTATPKRGLKKATGRGIHWVVLSLLSVGLSCQSAESRRTESPQVDTPTSPLGESLNLGGQRVEVAVVETSKGELELSVPGEVEGFRDAWLAAPLGGYIERVLVRKGSFVEAGAPLALVDRKTHAAREAQARLQLDVAKRELDRALALGGSIPRSELDQARDGVRLAEARISELALNTHRSTLRAPFSGVVVSADIERGEVAGPGAPLVRLVQLDPVKVTVSLSDRDMELAKEGSRARIRLDANSKLYEGTVQSLAPAADLKTRGFEAEIEVPNPDKALLPGMIANVTLRSQLGEGEEEQLVIAQDWIVTGLNGVGVFVESEGRARWRDVELGQILRKQVVVSGGLKPGDALIIVGHRELVDGDQVLVHRRGRCCREGRATFL